MTFTTLVFIVFLAVVFPLYWRLRERRRQNWLLLIASYLFYAWWDYRFCSLMLISSVVDYTIGLKLSSEKTPKRRRVLVTTSLVCNLGMLSFFKYFNFFADSFMNLAAAFGWQLNPLHLSIVLPIGISFYTFQTLSYTIDVYRDKLEPTRDFVAYMSYVSFFPQLVAGPIERAHRLLPQFLADRVFGPQTVRDGLRQMLWGFIKKMVVADRLAAIVNEAFAAPEGFSGPELGFAAVCFSFQVYCDFSAYSDIAIGTGKLFGIRLMRNFAYPFFSQSMGELWGRWHISLVTWFRDYVYIPLGGSRKGRARTVFNVMFTFCLSGAWHGAAWNFVIWGILCGLLALPSTVIWRPPRQKHGQVPGGDRFLPPSGVLFRMLLTFSLFTLPLCIFRAGSMAYAVLILGKISRGIVELSLFPAWTSARLAALGCIMALLAIEWIHRRHDHPLQLDALSRPARWTIYTVSIWGLLYLMAERSLTFVYYQF